MDHQFSKFSNHAVTIFNIQIVIMGWTQVYFWSASLILDVFFVLSFLCVTYYAVYDRVMVYHGHVVYFVYRSYLNSVKKH